MCFHAPPVVRFYRETSGETLPITARPYVEKEDRACSCFVDYPVEDYPKDDDI